MPKLQRVPLLYLKILVFLGIKLKNLVLLWLEGTEQLYAMQMFWNCLRRHSTLRSKLWQACRIHRLSCHNLYIRFLNYNLLRPFGVASVMCFYIETTYSCFQHINKLYEVCTRVEWILYKSYRRVRRKRLYFVLIWNTSGRIKLSSTFSHILLLVKRHAINCAVKLNWSQYISSVRTQLSRGSNCGGGEIFLTRPDQNWGLPSLLYNVYRNFLGGKADGAWHCPRAPIPRGV
jgi:hypothetical protein